MFELKNIFLWLHGGLWETAVQWKFSGRRSLYSRILIDLTVTHGKGDTS